MKRILFAMSLSICLAGTVTAQQENMSMKPYENEVRKDTIDTLGVKKETPDFFLQIQFLKEATDLSLHLP